MERPPNSVFNIARTRNGRLLFGLFALLVVVLALLIWSTRDTASEGYYPSLGEGQFYERDQEIIPHDRDSL